MYESSKGMSLLKKNNVKRGGETAYMGICGSTLKMKRNVSFPLNIILCCFMTIHLIRLIRYNSILDFQLDIKYNFQWEMLIESWGEKKKLTSLSFHFPQKVKYYRSVIEKKFSLFVQERSWFLGPEYKQPLHIPVFPKVKQQFSHITYQWQHFLYTFITWKKFTKNRNIRAHWMGRNIIWLTNFNKS